VTWPANLGRQVKRDARECAARRPLPERCARCHLDVASHRVERNGEVWCSWWCFNQHQLRCAAWDP
jgi:hypothetical protein